MLSVLVNMMILLLILCLAYWAVTYFGSPPPIPMFVGILCLLVLFIFLLNQFGVVGAPLNAGWGSETTTIRVTDR